MIEQRGPVLRLPVVYLWHRPAPRLAIFPCRRLIALVATRYRKLALPLTLVASALSAALAILGLTDGLEIKPDTTQLSPVRNETVVYRNVPSPQPNVGQESSEHPYTGQIEASDQLDDDNVPANFSRTVQTIRFIKLDASAEIGMGTLAARESIREALVKVGGFVVFRPKEAETGIDEQKESILPRERTGSIMDQVDDYLWEVYQRVPIKKDGTGDFTWKDPTAAKRMGLSLRDYVIGGMDAELREQLYHAGQAMDLAGLQWSMLSAFRDDYRQSLASGYKAGVSNSLHGGSRRTGGYGHGRAVDITGPEGRESEVWKWIDDHGAKYGLHRPLPKADPAHVQQRGDWHKIALALRESRTRSVIADKVKVAASNGKAKGRKTAVASAR